MVVLQTYREIKTLLTARIPWTEMYSKQEFFMTVCQGILFLEIPSFDIFIFSLLITKFQLKEGSFSYPPLLPLAMDFYPLPGNQNSGRREEDLHSGSTICLLPHGTVGSVFSFLCSGISLIA